MLCLLSSAAFVAVGVTLREGLLLLAVAFLIVIGLVTLCRYITEFLNKLFDGCCERLELWLIARKARRRPPSPPSDPPANNLPLVNNSLALSPAPVVTRKRPLAAHHHLRVVSAQDALRRSCQDQMPQ